MSDAKHRMQSFGIGHLLGLAGVPRPMIAKREPVAYLYNGVRLPKLPEWDRERYPYVAISENFAGPVFFGAVKKIDVQVNEETGCGVFYIPVGDGAVSAFSYLEHPQTGEWYAYSENQIIEDNPAYPGLPVWSNFDIYDMDGDLYLAESEPIPVYE